MKYLLCICIVIVIVGISSAYWIDSNEMSYPDDEISAVSKVKRFRKCMNWGMPCVSETRYTFAQCCSGLSCLCNLWKTHCKCRAKLG